jgi:MipA family protein
MISHHQLKFAVTIGGMLCSLTVYARGDVVSVGIMGIDSTSVYKETTRDNQLLPFFSYSGEHVFLRGSELGYHFLPKQSMANIGIGLEYDFSTFDPDDSNNPNIQLLDNRDDSVMATVNGRVGPIRAKWAQDISNTHNGYYAEISTGYPLHLQALTITPTISYRYIDKNMSNHQFGVSVEESARSSNAITAYDSSATHVTTLSIRSTYPITPAVMVNMNVSYLQYNDAILDSPVVAKDHKTVIAAGVIYRF